MSTFEKRKGLDARSELDRQRRFEELRDLAIKHGERIATLEAENAVLEARLLDAERTIVELWPIASAYARLMSATNRENTCR